MAWGPVRFGDGEHSYTFPYPQDILDNFAETQAKLLQIPGMAGGFDVYGVGAAPGVGGQVRLKFNVYSSDPEDMTSLIDAARQMPGWGIQRLIVQPTDPLLPERWCWARADLKNPLDIRRASVNQQIDVDFLVQSPYWYTQGTEGPLWGTFKWGAKNWGATSTVHSLTSSTSFTITPGGNCQTLARIILRTTAAQGFYNPVIRRLVGGDIVDELVFTNTAILASSFLIINPRARRVKHNWADWYPYMTARNPDWFRLDPGVENTITLNFERAIDSGSIQVAHFELWR